MLSDRESGMDIYEQIPKEVCNKLALGIIFMIGNGFVGEGYLTKVTLSHKIKITFHIFR